MPNTFEVAVLVGSLRKASLTRKVANVMMSLAPANLHCRLLEIGDLALYNADLESDLPASWARFRGEIAASHAALFLTPEYNRTVPACIKNAIDVGSRPPKMSVWSGKPAGVVSVAPGKMGGFGANHVLRQSFVFLDMPVMQQPEAYIGLAGELFDEHDGLKNEGTRTFLTQFMTAFERWVAVHAAGS